MTAPRDDGVFIAHMRGAIARVRSYLDGVDHATFVSSSLLQDAVIRQIQIVGEAAARLSPAYRQSHPSVEWNRVIGMRHKLVHDYFEVSIERVWITAVKELAVLEEHLGTPPEHDGIA
jgi:uncharacterized protein with HEPN domain